MLHHASAVIGKHLAGTDLQRVESCIGDALRGYLDAASAKARPMPRLATGIDLISSMQIRLRRDSEIGPYRDIAFWEFLLDEIGILQ